MSTVDPAVLQACLLSVVDRLRQDLRIKRGTDYCYTLKYGKLHVLCQEVYLESIQEVFERHSLDAKYITYTHE